jgi:hypothetical protein
MVGCATLPENNVIKPVEQSTKVHLGKDLSPIKTDQDQTVAYEWVGEVSAMPDALKVEDANSTAAKEKATINVRKRGNHMQH